ncbi:MAG TPA: hypothetical protein VNQ55_01525 [Parapedobacter sp.]|nr:hypothetical protein [Parapedobacter sp.]
MDCITLHNVLDSLQKEKNEQLALWIQHYGIQATAEQFNSPETIKTEYLSKGTFAFDEIDSRSLAISPDKKKGITYDGYFIDLAETPEDEIGLDDSHDIDLYDLENNRIHRIHFKGLAYSTDELFWLDSQRFILLGAINTGEKNQWIPYIQITNVIDSSSSIYRYKKVVQDVLPFEYLLKRLKRMQLPMAAAE